MGNYGVPNWGNVWGRIWSPNASTIRLCISWKRSTIPFTCLGLNIIRKIWLTPKMQWQKLSYLYQYFFAWTGFVCLWQKHTLARCTAFCASSNYLIFLANKKIPPRDTPAKVINEIHNKIEIRSYLYICCIIIPLGVVVHSKKEATHFERAHLHHLSGLSWLSFVFKTNIWCHSSNNIFW